MIPVIAATASCSADLPLQRGQAMDSTPPLPPSIGERAACCWVRAQVATAQPRRLTAAETSPKCAGAPGCWLQGAGAVLASRAPALRGCAAGLGSILHSVGRRCWEPGLVSGRDVRLPLPSSLPRGRHFASERRIGRGSASSPAGALSAWGRALC